MSRGRPFEPGNTFGRGRPKGSRNKSNHVIQELLDKFAEPLIRRNVAEGLQGNTKSRQWCLDRLLQAMSRPPKLKLPPIKTLEDITKAHDVILNAVASQKCAVVLGQALYAMVDGKVKNIEAQELKARLEVLEVLVKGSGLK